MNKAAGSVLIVDDDPLVLMNYSDILEDAGYVPTPTGGIEQAWNTAQHRDFDVVVCDHDLVDGKGSDLLKQFMASARNFPVIYLSAARPEVLEEVRKMPIVKEVLTKPVSPDKLLETIRNYAKKETSEKLYPRLIAKEERDMLLESTGNV